MAIATCTRRDTEPHGDEVGANACPRAQTQHGRREATEGVYY